MYGGMKKNCTVRYSIQSYVRNTDPETISIDGTMTKTFMDDVQNGM